MKLWEKNSKLIEGIDGKPVECDECPCEPPGCCLYPWPDPAGAALYFETDLPDALTNSTYGFFFRSGYTYIGPETTEGPGGDTEPGHYEFRAQSPDDPQGSWLLWWVPDEDTEVAVDSNGCLIGEWSFGIVYDEFPSMLSVDIPSLGISGMLIDRLDVDVNPCEYYGCILQPGESDIFVVVYDRYNSATYKWELVVETWSGSDCGALDAKLSTATFEKDPPQSSPAGNFDGNTVS